MNDKRFPQDLRKNVAALYVDEKLSILQIAARTMIHRSSVRRILIDQGIDRRAAELPRRHPFRCESDPVGIWRVPLTRGEFSFVDEDVVPTLVGKNWFLLGGNSPIKYAGTSVGRSFLYLHWHVLGATRAHGFVVDHIDYNGLNNTRANLRIVTCAQNVQRVRPQRGRTTRGVSWSKDNGKWEASIHTGGKRLDLGKYVNKADALRAYNKKASELFGEFAYINPIGGADND